MAVFGLATFFSLPASAQNSSLEKINSERQFLDNYITISSLESSQRPKFFSNLSLDDKANLMRFHLALQILKRPWLNQSQKDFLLETISTVSPQTYDQSNPQVVALNQQNAQILQQKMMNLFQKQEAVAIFVNLGGDFKDTEFLQSYRNATLPIYTVNRRHTFSRFSPVERSNAMRIHLLRHLSRPDFTMEQRRFILVALSFATPELYGTQQGTNERTNFEPMVKSFSSRVPEFFKLKDAAEIFLSPGGLQGQGLETASSEKMEMPNFIKANDISSIISSKNLLNLEREPLSGGCSCSTYSDYCSWETANTKCSLVGSCTPSNIGCGFMWLNSCTGLCIKKDGSGIEEGEN